MCDKDVKLAPDSDLNMSVCGVIRGIPTREETLGDIVMALLRSGQIISRRTICLKLIGRIEAATDPTLYAHLSDVMRLILRNQAL